jgi:hypothetical protein
MKARGMFLKASAVLAALAVGAVASYAQTATVTVTYSVATIQKISVSSPTVTLAINTVTTPGNQPDSAFTTGVTYAVTNNLTGSKITGVLCTALASGLDMDINLGAPTGATSAGQKQLSTTAQDLVTGIGKINQSGMSLYLQFDATSAAGVVASSTEVITLTLTGGA